MNVTLSLLAWPLLSVVAFKFLKPQSAVLWVLLGGWLVLPVGFYPPDARFSTFPYWLIGAALPSEMLISKAWIAPASALLGVLLLDRPRLRGHHFNAWDLPMVLWCLWPLLQWALRAEAQPTPLLASAYLLGSWGFTWLLGRLYFSSLEGQAALLHGLAWAGLACLPFAAVEGVAGPDLYATVYEPHPFASDGTERYLGWRPIGCVENGNQYGLWVCLCALAALWVWRSRVAQRRASWWAWGAFMVCGMALLAQSVGALLLSGLGLAVLALMARARLQTLWIGTLCASLLCGAVYLSGVVPVTQWGKETAVGRKVVEVFRASGRGSFTWRISQDQKAMGLVKSTALVGQGRWDWWRPLNTRPWGLALLLVGQFGLIGLVCAFGALLAPSMRCLWRVPVASPWQASGAPVILATMVVLTTMDAGLNAFIFFPALMAAGALVPRARAIGS
jgi:hypothetical protein